MTSSFILGILFTSLLWDGTVLFPKEQVTAATIEAVEAYYLTWWNGAMTVKVFLHVVVSCPPSRLEVVDFELTLGGAGDCALPHCYRQVRSQVRDELLLQRRISLCAFRCWLVS